MTERDDVLALAGMAQKCALYDFDSVEMVECKWADWNDIINALRRAAAPEATRDVTIYNDILGAVARGWCTDRNAHKEMDAELAEDIARSVAALTAPVERGREDSLDAARYRRLQVLGCAPYGSRQLDQASVLRFSGLDAFVDEDLRITPSRGEALSPLPSGNMDKPTSPLPLPSEQRLSTEAVAWREVSDADWQRAVTMADEILQHDLSKEPLGLTAEQRRKYLDNAMQHAFGSLSLRAHPPADRDAMAVERVRELLTFVSRSRQYEIDTELRGQICDKLMQLAAAIRNRGGDQ